MSRSPSCGRREVSIAAACALTGRSRATHYRRADPLGAALGPRAWTGTARGGTALDDHRRRARPRCSRC
ncbi:MAG: hypothetical protein WKF73_18760 [Nocardioidaceae bacterium]